MDMGGMMGDMAAATGGLDIVSVLKYVLLTLGGGALLGFVGGKIFAGIRYPNPEKRQLFNAWQKIAVLVVVLASLGLIVGAFLYKPAQPDMAVDGPAMSDTAGGEAADGTAEGGSAAAGGSVNAGGSVMIGGGGAVMIG